MTPQARDNVTEFSDEQAALLETLAAQNGDLDIGMYGYADMDSQANGLSIDFQDLAEPGISAALLEDIAAFEHGPEDQTHNFTPDDPFAGLLEAAVAAGEKSAMQEQAFSSIPDDGFFRRSFIPEDRSKRQWGVERTGALIEEHELISGKRQKMTAQHMSLEDSAIQRELWGSEDDEGDDVQDNFPASKHNPPTKSKTKSPGVQSAPALFRPPTKAPRKYSRPAMSKLFSSLELEPEPFLYLQAAAKSYMLDTNHPDRSKCVGIKGRGESDVTKLKLYATVKAFLTEEGWGVKCFGTGAPDISTRKLKWPQHEHKLIALVTPLMRRMVTNERQRQYAYDKRQGIVGTKERASSATPTESTPAPTPRPSEANSPLAYDPKIDQSSLGLESSMLAIDDQAHSIDQNESNPDDQRECYHDLGVRYHVNIMKDGRRINPKVMLTPSACPDFSNLTRHINRLIDGVGQKLKSIQVLGPGSLLEAKDEDTWRDAVEAIRKSEWMDGDVKCVVEVEAIA